MRHPQPTTALPRPWRAPLATLALIGALAALPLSASAADAPAMLQDGVYVGANGMSLYTFDQDMANSGKSTCNGPCAANWPPLMANAGATPMGDFKVITRDDGSAQWSLKGKPLYYWVKDQKPGDRSGDGFKGVWHLAR